MSTVLVKTKVENIHLPPLASVLALLQLPKQKDEQRADKYIVTNDGKVPIQIEVAHTSRIEDEHTHCFMIKSGETKVVELDEHFSNTVLKVTNKSSEEEAIFSAEGGEVPNASGNLAQVLPGLTLNDENDQKIEKFHLPPNSSIIAMYLERPHEDHKKLNYTVINMGKINLKVEVVHNTKKLFIHDHCFILKPQETKVIDLDEEHCSTSLKFINSNLLEEAIFSAIGGEVVAGLESNIETLTLSDVPTKIENLSLPPNSYLNALSYLVGENNGDKINENAKNYTVINHGPEGDLEIKVLHKDNLLIQEIHTKTLKPTETLTIELTPHFENSILSVINRNLDVNVSFSAEGGTSIPGVDHDIKKMKDEVADIEIYSLPPRSMAVVMTQKTQDDDKRLKNYTITNHSLVDLQVELLHGGQEDCGSGLTLIKPDETKIIELVSNCTTNDLRVINSSDKDTVIFSAEGGDVLKDFKENIQNLPDLKPKLPEQENLPDAEEKLQEHDEKLAEVEENLLEIKKALLTRIKEVPEIKT